MTVLVTGGSGFIGSHIVDKLVEQRYTVRVFDERKPLRDDVEWIKGNLLNENEVLEACKDIEKVYHFAAIADVNVALTHPKLCIEVNEIGTLNLLKAATAREVKRFILASTTWVYGRAEGVVDEETPIPPPDHMYTKTKIGQEHLVIAWHGQSGLPYTILRYGIPYGPRMRANMAIATFVSKAMHKEPIPIFGDGCQGRCFIQIEDLANGSLAALTVAAENQILNISSSEFVTINQIVEALKEHFPDLLTRQLPERPQDFRGNVVSIEKAKKTIKWMPKISFKKGLESYIEHVKCGST